jgi:hypothetical protein
MGLPEAGRLHVKQHMSRAGDYKYRRGLVALQTRARGRHKVDELSRLERLAP